MRKIVTFETIDGKTFENFKEAQNHENRLTKIQISVDDLIDKILEFDNSNLDVDEVDLEDVYSKVSSIIGNFLKYNQGRKVWKKYSLIDNDGDVEEVIWGELIARIYVQKVIKLYKDLPYTKKQYLELVRYWERKLKYNRFEYIHKSILESLEALRILHSLENENKDKERFEASISLKELYNFLKDEYNSNLIKNWANKSYRKRNEVLELYSLKLSGIEIKYIEDMYSCGVSIKKDGFAYGYTLADIDGERNQADEYEKMLKTIYSDSSKLIFNR